MRITTINSLTPISLLLGLSAALYLLFRSYRRYAELKMQETGLRAAEKLLQSKEHELETLRHHVAFLEEKLQLVQKNDDRLMESFRALSIEALEKNSAHFLQVARHSLEQIQERTRGEWDLKTQAIHEVLKPVKESLGKLDEGVKTFEKERQGDHRLLVQLMQQLQESEKTLTKETSNLTRALQKPTVRGFWGEMQLRRVVELAGMVQHCDFLKQESSIDDTGSIFRPDLIIKLPGQRQVVIDAKAPLGAYLEAVQIEDERLRIEKLKEHSRQVRYHLTQLGKKAYHEQFQPTPEFVILFLPAETILSAALEMDPTLLEFGVEQSVVLATPTTLITLLRSISYGWKQDSLSKHVQEVSDLGRKLYKRLVDMADHLTKLGRALTTAVGSYNETIGSLESRVLVTARKFKELGGMSDEELRVEPVEKMARTITLSSKEE